MPLRGILFSALCLAVCVSGRAYGQDPSCPPSAPDGYRRHTMCTVTIDRNNPASPSTIVVKAGTTVNITLAGARANEAVAFTPSTTQQPPVDVAATFLKSAITPLSSLIINTRNYVGAKSINLADLHIESDPVGEQLNDLLKKLDDVLGQMADASVQLSCLEGYRVLDGKPKGYFCKVDLLTADTFGDAKVTTINSLQDAAKAVLPVATLADLKTTIDKDVTASTALPQNNQPDRVKRTVALAKDDLYLSLYTVLNSAIGDTQKAQTTMLETAEQLSVLANGPASVTFSIKQGKSFNSSVTVVAQEVISKTNTTVATVTVNWVSNPWEVSTGIMFSKLVNTSFTNGPLLVGGKPQFDDAGKNLTVVQETDNTPTVMFPVVMTSYRIGYLSRFNWENRCSNHCAFLLTGGVGLNLNSKTAEFAVGPSFQFGGVLITPGWHIGRENELAQGVAVGAQLGSSPPSPLPMSSSWTAKFGVAISYILPFQ